MKLKSMSLWATALVCLCEIPTASAVLGYRTAEIAELQLEGSMNGTRADTVWIRMDGTWPGVTCGADWAWFNSQDNPQFLATALTARSTNMPLRVYVEDGSPKKDGYCQITTLSY